jgi:hypothetical protein
MMPRMPFLFTSVYHIHAPGWSHGLCRPSWHRRRPGIRECTWRPQGTNH